MFRALRLRPETESFDSNFGSDRLPSHSPSSKARAELNVVTLDGFKELGELLLALHYVCKPPICANEKHAEKLEEFSTTENVKKSSGIMRTSRLGR